MNGNEGAGDRVEPVGDHTQPVLYDTETGVDLIGHGIAGLVWRKGFTSAQYRVEMAGMPAERERQRFERSGTTGSLHGVVLNLAHDGLLRYTVPRPLGLRSVCIVLDGSR